MNKRWPDKKIVGLTGNIATGKSAVMRMADENGALILDADKIVHELLDDRPQIQAAIADVFGGQIRRPDGRIDRAALAAVVFNDPAALHDLERLVHPEVRHVLFERIEANEATIVFIEAIKLLEGNLATICDEIWVTRCPEVIQIERLRVCRGMDDETAAMRVRAQSPQEEKVARADVVIDTDGLLVDTRQYFDLAWERLIADLPWPPRPAGRIPLEPPAPVTESPEPVEPVEEPARRPPPKRLSASGAAELRKRLKTRAVPATEDRTAEPSPAQEAVPEAVRADNVIVRRARPSDVPSILLLIQQATGGRVRIKRSELLLALGERGYLIGQKGTDISAVAGWSSEDLVARIDQMYIHPLSEAGSTGSAVLQEIVDSASKLICECILAFPANDGPVEIVELLLGHGFKGVQADRLPRLWQTAVEESRPEDTSIMLRVLRDTRITQPIG